MGEKKHADYSEHKREHDRFLDEFGKTMARMTATAGSRSADVLREELRHWIVGHVLTSDKKNGRRQSMSLRNAPCSVATPHDAATGLRGIP